MLTEISPRVPPAPTGPTTELDYAIMRVLADGKAREPREIFEQIINTASTLQRVHARLRVLVNRGVLTRLSDPSGPQRGPGAGVYTVT